MSRLRANSRKVINVVSLAVIAGSLLILSWFIVYDESAERHLVGERPYQFYVPLQGDLLDDYAEVFGIAHNSGDDLRIAREALAYGADVIEIDVVSIEGQLYASHLPPVPFTARYTFRGPTLRDIWEIARQADAVLLDLKESSPRYTELVIAFLNEHPDELVMVSSRDPAVLRQIEARAPHAFPLPEYRCTRTPAHVEGRPAAGRTHRRGEHPRDAAGRGDRRLAEGAGAADPRLGGGRWVPHERAGRDGR
jgi:hypothetical protein